MGDSITEAWKIEGPTGTFPGKPYVNRGISGQTTPQMLVRFRQDVIALKPKVVVTIGQSVRGAADVVATIENPIHTDAVITSDEEVEPIASRETPA